METARIEIRANGLRFSCLAAGKGPLVLLLHGFPQNANAWRRQIPALAARFRVVAPDMRGYGGSDKPPRVADYSAEALAADVKGLIEALGETKARVVGHDWGGGAAWAAALRHPECVERLAVLNCPHPRAFLSSGPRQWRRSWYMGFFQLPWLPERALARDGGALVGRLLEASSAPGTFSKEDLRAYGKAFALPGAARAALNYYRAALRGLGTVRRLSRGRIAAPTLVIWGDRDAALGVELTDGMEAFFDGPFRLEKLSGASHWVNEERPDDVNRLLLDFL